MISFATHYTDFKISPTYEIPQSLREILYTAWQFQYEELYEEKEKNTISLEEILNQILEALNSDKLGHQRYIIMAIILAKAVEPTILAYKPNNSIPQEVFKYINQKLEQKNVSNNLIKSLFTQEDISYQAFDEAMDVFQQILYIFEPEKAKNALLAMLDDCLEGYAIFPGSEGRRDLFNWWLLEVVPASWCLEYPKFIYTINKV